MSFRWRRCGDVGRRSHDDHAFTAYDFGSDVYVLAGRLHGGADLYLPGTTRCPTRAHATPLRMAHGNGSRHDDADRNGGALGYPPVDRYAAGQPDADYHPHATTHPHDYCNDDTATDAHCATHIDCYQRGVRHSPANGRCNAHPNPDWHRHTGNAYPNFDRHHHACDPSPDAYGHRRTRDTGYTDRYGATVHPEEPGYRHAIGADTHAGNHCLTNGYGNTPSNTHSNPIAITNVDAHADRYAIANAHRRHPA